MKLARNLFLALALLVLLYGGVYWVFLRERLRYASLWESPFAAAEEKPWDNFFAPATELDLRMTYYPALRKSLQGRWIDAATGDFVTVLENDTCAFQLREYRYSGKVTFDRRTHGYSATFQDGGISREFSITKWLPFSFEGEQSHYEAFATIVTPTQPWRASEHYTTSLTRAPAPAP